MDCYTNCSSLNISSCMLLDETETALGSKVIYDEDGCFEENIYLGIDNKYLHYLQFAKMIAVVTMVAGGAGILANCLNIFVLSRPEMKNCFNQILIGLNITDSLHIGFAILDGIRNNFEGSYPTFLMRIFPYFHYPFYRITMCSSIFLVMGTSVERFLAVCRPHHYRNVQDRPYRSLLYIIPSVTAALIMNIPRFQDTEVFSSCWDLTGCGCEGHPWLKGEEVSVRPTQLRRTEEYVVWYHTWLWGFTTGLIPVICLIYLNTRIYRAMKTIKTNLNNNKKKTNIEIKGSESARKRLQQQKRDCTLSFILTVTVIMFFVFHSPRIIISVYESLTIQNLVQCNNKGLGYYHIWYLYVQVTLQLLQVLNSSQNLLIYWFVGSGFKTTAKKYLRCYQEAN